jgi:hypothetical protein
MDVTYAETSAGSPNAVPFGAVDCGFVNMTGANKAKIHQHTLFPSIRLPSKNVPRVDICYDFQVSSDLVG